MNPTEIKTSATGTEEESAAAAKAKRIKTVSWLTGVTAVFALISLSDEAHGASIGMGLGVIGVAGMVAAVSYFIVKD